MGNEFARKATRVLKRRRTLRMANQATFGAFGYLLSKMGTVEAHGAFQGLHIQCWLHSMGYVMVHSFHGDLRFN